MEHGEILAIDNVAHLGVRGTGLLERDLRGHRDEGADGVVERLGAGEVVLGKLDGRDLAGADRGRLLEGSEVMECGHPPEPRSPPGKRWLGSGRA